LPEVLGQREAQIDAVDRCGQGDDVVTVEAVDGEDDPVERSAVLGSAASSPFYWLPIGSSGILDDHPVTAANLAGAALRRRLSRARRRDDVLGSEHPAGAPVARIERRRLH